jgi:hypothetical protein
MKYIIALVVMVSMSFALIPYSFRYQSTAGVWEDDYDLLFDPARITEIQGSRLYTSLSNFVTGGEELFSNGSVPFILIGGSTNWRTFYPGLIFDNSSIKSALFTGLNDPYGNPIYGDASLTIIDWDNPDTLGNFQNRSVTTETRSAYDVQSVRDLYLGIGTQMNGIRLGFGFMRTCDNTTFTDPINNFTYSYFDEDIANDSLTFLTQARAAGDDIFNTSENNLILSAWFNQDRASYGITATYAMLGWTRDAVIIGDSSTYNNPQDPLTNYTAVALLDSVRQPRSGKRLDIELKTFYNYTEYAQGRFYLGLFTQSTNYGDDAVDYDLQTRSEIFDDYTYDTTRTLTYYDGSTSTKGLSFGTKQLFTISERLKFGVGLFFITSSYSDSLATRDTTVNVIAYDNGDTLQTILDFTATTWSSETWMTKTSGSTKEFIIPLGLEFYLAKPLVFRLGAQHTLSFNDYNTTTSRIDYQAERTLIVFGDGSELPIYPDPGPAPDDVEVTETESVPKTDYFYGIGWRVSNYFQIDLMGFNNVTDLSNWRLSATLRFD